MNTYLFDVCTVYGYMLDRSMYSRAVDTSVGVIRVGSLSVHQTYA